VWVCGSSRVVSGVSESTTCQDLIVALAQATNRTGRFTLVEKWRKNERLLSPNDYPLQVLQKWGEYAADVQLILRHSSETPDRGGSVNKHHATNTNDQFKHNFSPHDTKDRCHEQWCNDAAEDNSAEKNYSIRKSLSFSGVHMGYKGSAGKYVSKPANDNGSLESINETASSPSSTGYSLPSYSSKSNSASPHSSLDRLQSRPMQYVPPNNSALQRLSPAQEHHPGKQSTQSRTSRESRRGPTTEYEYSVDGRSSADTGWCRAGEDPDSGGTKSSRVKGLVNGTSDNGKVPSSGMLSKSELMKLVKLQQERISEQQQQLHTVDKEVTYWHGRDDELSGEAAKLRVESARLQHEDVAQDAALQELQATTWDSNLKTELDSSNKLNSLLSEAQSRLSLTEKSLLAAHQRALALQSDIERENELQAAAGHEQKEQEFKVLQEIADMQKQVNQQLVQHEQHQGELDTVSQEVKRLESQILERKTQLAAVEQNLKESNMEGFNKSPTECLNINNFADNMSVSSFARLSPARPGSGRKMTHSPQLLKDSVATVNNPDGLWV